MNIISYNNKTNELVARLTKNMASLNKAETGFETMKCILTFFWLSKRIQTRQNITLLWLKVRSRFKPNNA